jgi:hypothetical protein
MWLLLNSEVDRIAAGTFKNGPLRLPPAVAACGHLLLHGFVEGSTRYSSLQVCPALTRGTRHLF